MRTRASDSVHRHGGGHSFLATETGTLSAFLSPRTVEGASDSVPRQRDGHSCGDIEIGTQHKL